MNPARRVEAVLEDVVASTPLSRLVEPKRLVRFLEFLVVGASGAIIDVSITVGTLSAVHYLIANGAGFLVANSWNYGLNRRYTFDSPDGSFIREYPAYLGWHTGTFVVRAGVVSLLVEGVGTPVAIASVIGIGAAALANFIGAESIIGIPES